MSYKQLREVVEKLGIKVPKGSEHLHFRVPAEAKMLYILLPASKRRAVKKALVATILALHQGGQARLNDEEGPVIYNFSITLNEVEAKAEARAEARVEVKAEEVADALRALREVAGFLRELEPLWIRDQPLRPRVRRHLDRLARAEKVLQKLATN